MWCTAHPSIWKQHPVPEAEEWSIAKINLVKERIER